MLNKQAANEEAGFDVERDKIRSLDKNIVNMTADTICQKVNWLTNLLKKFGRRMGKSIRPEVCNG